MDLRTHLESQERISANDVLYMRRDVFHDGAISDGEAEDIFALNDAVTDTCPEWDAFFVECLTEFCVHQAEPQGYISPENADWLIARIASDGHVKSSSELELLVKIIEAAKLVPEQLAAYALEEVAHAVLHGDGALLRNENLTPGVIGQPEAKLIRRIMYGVGSQGRITISKAEVAVLFDLNDKTIEAQNHPEWNDVFVKAVGAHLMMSCGYENISRAEALQREAWLDDSQPDTMGMLSRTLSSVGSLLKAATWTDALQSPTEAGQQVWNARNSVAQQRAMAAAPVTSAEAEWLAGRINRDGVMHENEIALLRFVKQEADHIDPALQPLLDQVA